MKFTAVRINGCGEYGEFLSIAHKLGATQFVSEPESSMHQDNFCMWLSGNHIRWTLNDGRKKLITLAEFKKEQNIMKYSEGDVLEHVRHSDKEVLATCGRAILVSQSGGPNTTDGWYTESELYSIGWTLKTDEPELTELTLEQVAEKMNIPVSQLRIKD